MYLLYFVNGISHDDFDSNVMHGFSVRPIICFLVQPFLLNPTFSVNFYSAFGYVLFDCHVQYAW